MDWKRIEYNWKEFRGLVKERWARLSAKDLTEIDGKRERLEKKLQRLYDREHEVVKREIDRFCEVCGR